ncbi:MAG: immune inhibitor A [Bacteroidetes bacterium]|nr:immune inhibitor A [Bacteroidota bacterium]
MKRFIAFMILLTISFSLSAQQQKYSRVKLYLDGKDIKEVAKLGVNVENGKLKKGKYFIGELSATELGTLKKNGYAYDVLIEDMSKYYKDRNKGVKSEKKKKSSESYPTPDHFKLGSMGGFLTYNEMLQEFDSMRLLYPSLISLKQPIGTTNTIEGRQLIYVKISDNPDTDENEPEVLYTGLHHAREPAGMQQLIFFMYYLLENYNTNDEIKYLVDNLEMYFIPCVNPDGYVYNQTTDPDGGGMHRKNMRPNGTGNPGVDLNRNYGYEWGYDDVGSSNDPSDDPYRGTAGFSEPETQLIRDFCNNRTFKLAINYHCYSNLLIYPWGYLPDYETPDSSLFHNYSALMTAVNNYIYGTPMQTVGYTGNGTSDDWMYGEQSTKPKIIAFSPEAGNADDGFWPAINRIEDVCRANMDMNFYIARFALKYAKITDLTPTFISSQNDYINFNLKCLGLDAPADFTVSISPLTSNIQSAGNSKTFYSMATLQEANDSIDFSLVSTIQPGQNMKFLINVDNGLYIYSDTISKIYGQPQIVFTDPGNTITNWTSTGWNTTTASYHSPTKSITDSPTGDYNMPPVNSSITLTQAVNLANATNAYLTFWAKWDVNPAQDSVILRISTNNGSTWTPLAGHYTSAVNMGHPVYNGLMPNWVQEVIDLSPYVGQSVKFRFTLKSQWNYMQTYDGFYFDDFTVSTIPNTVYTIPEITDNIMISEIFPVPAKDQVVIHYNIPYSTYSPHIHIYNSIAQEIFSKNIGFYENSVHLDLSGFCPGIYFFGIDSESKFSMIKKLVIVK